jgi:hypothetical protein
MHFELDPTPMESFTIKKNNINKNLLYIKKMKRHRFGKISAKCISEKGQVSKIYKHSNSTIRKLPRFIFSIFFLSTLVLFLW